MPARIFQRSGTPYSIFAVNCRLGVWPKSGEKRFMVVTAIEPTTGVSGLV